MQIQRIKFPEVQDNGCYSKRRNNEDFCFYLLHKAGNKVVLKICLPGDLKLT